MAYIPKKTNTPTKPSPVRKTPPQTSWGSVADWYDTYLEVTPDSYQAMVIAPNLLRVLAIKSGERILDVACGQGYFTRAFAEAGAVVAGADISRELIARAKKRAPKISFFNAPAHQLAFAKDASCDVITIILAIQNIENITEVFAEAKRVLKPGGRLVLVMNHPAFRIPKRTSWGWDDAAKIQFRRTDGYLSAATISIDMHPGKLNSPKTVSYHRSLQDFFKALSKSGFAVSKLEEWISHKKSEKGPKQLAEDTARKEIPLFLMMECRAM
jgi:ubiquinone/menaquinone biosynthesis C-methylase UbiE